MNILIDVAHPAHVHMFRCFAHEMIANGHKVLFTTRDKEFEIALLEAERLPYINLGRKRNGRWSRVLFNLQCEAKLFRVARCFHADIFLSHGSIVAAHVAWLQHKPAIAFEDTFNMEQVKLYLPFTSLVLTGDYDHPLHSDKVRCYPGYHELLYMHPQRFQPMSREKVTALLGLQPDERYVVLRFVSWHATHDKGHKGLSMDNKMKAVERLSRYAKVFISSESELPESLQSYRLPTPPEQVGHVLAYAALVFGESATMVSEAAMLGVPGIYIDNTGRYYTRDLQNRYGLCCCYTESPEDQKQAIRKAEEWLSLPAQTLADAMRQRADRMLATKIDVTRWLCWLIAHYPASAREVRAPGFDWEKWKK